MSKVLRYQDKIKTRDEMTNIVSQLRRQNKKVVMTGGFFDILHPGHTRYLQQAKNMGDVLIVALNSDESTRKNKGPKRPINPQGIRAEILAALESVDYVVIFDEVTPKEIIAEIKPNVWVKGGQYKAEEMPESPIVRSCGGEIKIVPLVGGFSVSDL